MYGQAAFGNSRWIAAARRRIHTVAVKVANHYRVYVEVSSGERSAKGKRYERLSSGKLVVGTLGLVIQLVPTHWWQVFALVTS